LSDVRFCTAVRYTQTNRRVRTDREARSATSHAPEPASRRSASERGGHAGGAEAGTLAGRERQGKSKPSCWGGERAGMRVGSSVGRPRWVRILVTTGGSSMVAMKRRRPPHPAHASTSIKKTLFIRSAHAQARRARSAGGDGRDAAGGAGCGAGAGTDTGVTGKAGGDTARGGATGADVVSGGTGGASAAEAGDSGTGGTRTAGSSDARGRHRARGARQPWYKSKLMCGRGVMAAKRSRNS